MKKKKYYKNLRKGHHEPIIKQDLLEDIEEGRFIVCLVPKIDVATGNVAGAEALVHYHHKDLGIMEPGRYINLLEETDCPIIWICMFLRRSARPCTDGSWTISDDSGFCQFCRHDIKTGQSNRRDGEAYRSVSCPL